jgi:hypothetical protein
MLPRWREDEQKENQYQKSCHHENHEIPLFSPFFVQGFLAIIAACNHFRFNCFSTNDTMSVRNYSRHPTTNMDVMKGINKLFLKKIENV